MHVLHELVCGIRGAELGTVDIYRRGTSTRVTYYTSFEGDGSTTPTSGTTLDSNGGGEFYVNETVDVVVRNSGGVEVRRFTSAPAATAVEVISQSFTGTDYDSGETGASKPLALSAVLDLWKTNSGATDWKVLFGGVATTLQNAFATVGGVFVNVKATTYGALGDSTTDDTSAIQAAVDAAEAAGGGTVFFPAGTYKTTAALTIPAGVSLLGVGAAASYIALASGVAHVLTYEADTNYTSVANLRVGHSQASTGRAFNLAGVLRLLRVDNCVIGNASTSQSTGVYFDTAGTAITLSGCVFDMDTSSGYAVRLAANVAAVSNVIGCKVRFNGASSSNGVFSTNGIIVGCLVDGSGMTSGAATIWVPQSTAVASAFLGNSVTNPTGGTIAAWSDGGTSAWHEFGNFLGSSVTWGATYQAGAESSYMAVHSLHRDRARFYVQSDAAAITIEQGKYGTIEIERTNTDAQTITLTTAAGLHGPPGEEFVLIYNNSGHGSATGTITVANAEGISTFTVNANSSSVYFFKSVNFNGLTRWCMVGSALNQT